MVSALDFQTEGQRFEPGLYHLVVSLDRKLHTVSLQPGV